MKTASLTHAPPTCRASERELRRPPAVRCAEPDRRPWGRGPTGAGGVISPTFQSVEVDTDRERGDERADRQLARSRWAGLKICRVSSVLFASARAATAWAGTEARAANTTRTRRRAATGYAYKLIASLVLAVLSAQRPGLLWPGSPRGPCGHA